MGNDCGVAERIGRYLQMRKKRAEISPKLLDSHDRDIGLVRVEHLLGILVSAQKADEGLWKCLQNLNELNSFWHKLQF